MFEEISLEYIEENPVIKKPGFFIDNYLFCTLLIVSYFYLSA